MKLLFAFLALLSAAVTHAASPAEQQVAEAVKAPGVSVVHFWAPWCSNCQAELKSGGWSKTVADHPQTKFLFVSVWNGGDDGRAALARFGIGEQPNVTVLADPGPRGAAHIRRFNDLPLTWIPTTWVYKAGELRYALNYGEVRFELLGQLLSDCDSEWSHKEASDTK